MQALAEALLTLATVQGFPLYAGVGDMMAGLGADHAWPGRGGAEPDGRGAGGVQGERAGDAFMESYRLQGELLLWQATPDVAQPEACFQHALAIARRQQAKSWELRAAVSLSRLWQQQGKRAEARELLGPIYAWFTEGFDTADLQEAKALLAALT